MKEMIGDCPLGSKCEEVKTIGGEQVLVRCPWHTKLQGKNPQNGETIDDFRCAIAYLPLLLVNGANETRKGAAEITSLRKEVSGNANTVKLTSIQLKNGQLPKELTEGGK